MATKPYFGPEPPVPEMTKPPQDTEELFDSMGMGGLSDEQRKKVHSIYNVIRTTIW